MRLASSIFRPSSYSWNRQSTLCSGIVAGQSFPKIGMIREGRCTHGLAFTAPATTPRPAFFEDQLSVDIYIDRMGSKSMTYRHVIRRGPQVLADGRVTAVCSKVDPVTHQITSCQIPDNVREKFQAMIDSANASTSHSSSH